jgi:hypothetical protein
MLGNQRRGGGGSASPEAHRNRASMAILIGLPAVLVAIFLLHRAAKQQEFEAQRQAPLARAEKLGTLTRPAPQGHPLADQQRAASSDPGGALEYLPDAEPVIEEVPRGQGAVRQ